MPRILLALISVCLLLCIGCKKSGPELGRVRGTVTKNGQPVVSAVLEFSPIGGGRPSMAQSDASGTYEAFFTRGNPGATLGDHKIRYELLGGSPEKVGGDPDAVNKKTKLMPEAITVVAGDNEINFELVPVTN